MDQVASIEEMDDSKFPLPAGGSRTVHPTAVVGRMAAGTLTKGLYPMAAGHYRAVRRHIVPPRTRPSPMLIYCLSGYGSMEVENRTTCVGAGDFIVLPADVEHAYASDDKQPWTVLWIYFSGRQSDQYCRLMQTGNVVHIGVKCELIEALTWQLEWGAQGYSDGTIARACARLAMTLTEFAVAADRHEAMTRDPNIAKARSWMMERLDRPITLAEAALISGLSPFHFVRKFRSVTGYSPVMFHTVLRMQRACEFLDDTSDPVALIGEQLGYLDPQHFSRVFKRVMGTSPRAYRMNNLSPDGAAHHSV